MARQTPRALVGADSAVTPVIGTLLILAITIVGMVGILAWGAPTIQAIQAQNAQLAMVGEFEDVRSGSIDLSIPDASRTPTINVPSGTLGLERGTRFLITSNQDATNNGCDFRVTDWENPATPTQVEISWSGCRSLVAACPPTSGQACLEILQVSGSNTVQLTVTVNITGANAIANVTGVNFTKGDWLFRLSSGNGLAPTVYAQAWLFENDLFAWRLSTGQGGSSAYFDGGAVFSQDGGSYFLEKSPSLQENEFGSGVYSLRLRTLSDAGVTRATVTAGSHQVFLGLVGNYVRINSNATYLLRYDFQGELAEAWCGSLALRGADLTGARYDEDPARPCHPGSINPNAVRSITYRKTNATESFLLEVIHANIRASIAN